MCLDVEGLVQWGWTRALKTSTVPSAAGYWLRLLRLSILCRSKLFLRHLLHTAHVAVQACQYNHFMDRNKEWAHSLYWHLSGSVSTYKGWIKQIDPLFVRMLFWFTFPWHVEFVSPTDIEWDKQPWNVKSIQKNVSASCLRNKAQNSILTPSIGLSSLVGLYLPLVLSARPLSKPPWLLHFLLETSKQASTTCSVPIAVAMLRKIT